MGLSNSLYASISGLNTMGSAMSVLGDNVSNVNTIAFKSSRATFQDVLSQSVATAAGSAQVGRGVTLATIDGLFAQGSFESTSTATDLAIGGQGFFMLRSPESASADMYTRSGEFRFNKEGFLVNPSGSFVQGWTIDETTGDITGTIGDINLGKSTPPVETTSVQVIANVDSRKANEATESRLYDAWDGRNAAAAVPTDPIASAAYEYTTAIKIFDSKGASHDISIYFDRTTKDNQWEFLVTCEPQEDQRVLSDGLDASGSLDGSNDEITIYAPDTRFNYNNHKGAGALLYGVVDFSTSGAIDNIWAYNVPPDGEVDPSLNTNRIVLSNTDQYYTFESNFTGAATNQQVKLNMGAKYSGQSTSISQILVSQSGAFTSAGGTNSITKETLWSSVFDSAGLQMSDGDVFYFSGFDNDGTAVSSSYTVNSGDKVQKLLDALDTTFGCSATIDASGRLVMTDKTGGDSGMYVTAFNTTSVNNSSPFGGSATVDTPVEISGTAAIFFASDAVGTALSDETLALAGKWDATGNLIGAADTWTFTGVDVAGGAVGPSVFTVAANTGQQFLTWLEGQFNGGTAGAVTATLGGDGRIRLIDNTGTNPSVLAVTDVDTVSGGGAVPMGPNNSVFADGTVTSTLVDITTSKRQVFSPLRGVNTAAGTEPVITANTDWLNVFESGAGSTAIALGDTITVTGTRGDGTAVTAQQFTVAASGTTTANTFGAPLTAATGTVQDFLTWLESEFNAEASIDGAGRLVLTDRTADEIATGGYTSSLAMTTIVYSGTSTPWGGTGVPFSVLPPDTSGEDGSRNGDVVSIDFTTEALTTTQYANSSTTIFQDQNGFAAGFLQSVSVDTDGVITGNYSNGQVIEKAQVSLAGFNNLAGLNKEGGNVFRETTQSGAPVTGAPGTNGLGSIAPNSLEQSNVDLGTEFVKLITTQRGFQANSKIITTTDEMLADLINIKR